MSRSLREMALEGKPLTDALIIDWHVHLGRWALSHLAVADEEMIPAMDRVGVAKICVNGIIYSDMREGNDRVAAFARRFPDRVVPFAGLNPFQGNMVDELKRCRNDLGMSGVKIHSMIAGPHSPDLRALMYDWEGVWRFCADAKWPILAHGILTDDDIRRHPETVFVIAHGIQLTERVRKVGDCANLYVDTAWSQNKAWSLPALVDALGVDRILWGTDAPLDDFAQRLGIVLDSGLPEEDQRKILGLNAARLLAIAQRSA